MRKIMIAIIFMAIFSLSVSAEGLCDDVLVSYTESVDVPFSSAQSFATTPVAFSSAKGKITTAVASWAADKNKNALQEADAKCEAQDPICVVYPVPSVVKKDIIFPVIGLYTNLQNVQPMQSDFVEKATSTVNIYDTAEVTVGGGTVSGVFDNAQGGIVHTNIGVTSATYSAKFPCVALV